MATTADIPRLEMLQVADMVAREKGIEREEVLEAMEQAIQKSGRAKYGLEHDIRAEIDRKTGEIKLLRYMQVADPIENENTQVPLVEAQRRNPEAQVGDFIGRSDHWRRISETWPDPDLGDGGLVIEIAARLTDYIVAIEPVRRRRPK